MADVQNGDEALRSNTGASAVGLRASLSRDASSPLRIIALFIALSETLATVGATATDGTARMMMTTFAVSFPFVVLVLFVWLLVAHTAKLYAPSEYTADTSIESFVMATRRQQRDAHIVIRNAIGATVATQVETAEGATAASEADMRDRLIATYDEAISQFSVTVVRGLILAGAEDYQVPISDRTTVQELLDSVYFSLVPAVGPYTYGMSWVLIRGDHEVLADLGSNWAQRNGRTGDDRPLAEVGIAAGTTLTAAPRGHRKFPA
jgi:hypothetical protein